MKINRIVPLVLLTLLLCSCSKPEPAETPSETSAVPNPAPTPPASAAMPGSVGSVTNITDELYDAYAAARKQITRHYSEYVSNYEKTFGKSSEVKLPQPGAKDPYINISIPVLIDVDRASFDETLQKPLALTGGDPQLSDAYKRLYDSLAPLETAYKAARDYYLDGDAQDDSFAKSQAFHDSMRACSTAYTDALSEFSSLMRVLDKVRRSEKLELLLKGGTPVRYNVESMLAYGGDIAAFLKDFNDERPYHKGDVSELRPMYDDFVKYADAVLDYTGEDLIKEGFKEEFSHMFPSFFACVQKMRLTAQNILIIMEKQDMNAPLPTLPPDANNIGMAPEEALSTFAENYSTAGKLYKAFIATEEKED